MDALATVERDTTVERLLALGERTPQERAEQLDHFGPGLYLRELRVRRGLFAVGAVHRTEHLSIVIGHCLLKTDEGWREFIGCNVVRSKPGAQRAMIAVTDTIVITAHPTEETDPVKLVELLTESKASELAGGADNLQLHLAGAAGLLGDPEILQ